MSENSSRPFIIAVKLHFIARIKEYTVNLSKQIRPLILFRAIIDLLRIDLYLMGMKTSLWGTDVC